MKKSKRKLILSLLLMICISCGILGGCSVSAENKGDRSEFGGGEVPITDLAATYKGNATDADGNLLAPFDVVYPKAFASGDYKYDETAALLKFGKNFDGEITKDLKSCGFTSLEKTMTNTDGTAWYRASVSESSDVKTAVKKARSLKAVLIADFDYIYEDNSVEASQSGANAASSDIDGLIDDVLSNIQVKDQWYLTSCNIQKSWRWLKSKGVSAGGDPSVTVAVIDTGVDYTHPDLKANMWVNTGEIPGNGIDDDGDGYIDDVYGCSTVSDARFHTGDPMDDHGHGTHVAGIIAAANNKVGTVGVAYNVKIMAVKAGQATGVFLQSDIAEAIVYAYTHGADVINMSFGGSACSIAVQDALQSAYTTSTLVAAAGNDGMPNELTDNYDVALPTYPAALSYVVGVMSVNALGVESSFTNWDVSAYNSVEYEVYAPGEAMLSTLPDNRYGKLNGTSMATPLVSGIAALLRSYYTDRDMYPSKFVSAQLCATSGDTAHCFAPEKHTVNGMPHNLPMIVNAYDALTKLPKPDVNLYGYYLFDDEAFSSGNNGDGVIDAGETINIGTILRNRWGMSKNTVVKIDASSSAGVANPYVEILTGSVNFDGVGTYSTKDNLTRNDSGAYTGVENPLVVKVADDCPNDYLINLNVTITFGNGLDDADNGTYTTEGTISFAVRNGVVLPGQITEDMTLTKDNYYIIPNSTVIAEGVTVTVEPGTKIQFWSNDPEDPYADQYIAYLQVKGKFITNGTLEEPVELFPSELMSQYEVCLTETGNGKIELNYTNVTNATLDISVADHCVFTQNCKKIRCRYLGSLGVVNTEVSWGLVIRFSESGRLFRIANARNSNFYNIGNNQKVFGHYETSQFAGCSLQFNNLDSSFRRCVFNGNNRDGEASLVYLHGLTQDQIRSCSFSVTGKEDTLTSYIKITTSKAYTLCRDVGYVDIFRLFAKYLGGDLACIESQDEIRYVRTNVNGYAYVVGQIYGSDEWINGEKLNDWVITNSTASTNRSVTYSAFYEDGGKIYLENVEEANLKGILLEVPYHNNGNKWTKEEVNAEWLAFLNGDENTCGFIGNVILNNVNEGNTDYWMKVRGDNDDSVKIGVSGNYWGTTDIDLINKQIVDYDDYKNLADIVIGNYLTTAPSNTFPFVTDAYVLNSNGERARTVSNETCTFVVEFNRDMDTTIPLRVRFGSSKPYAEYEISGKYVSARRWEGVYTLKTTIENGNQYFNIENARAADDRFLRLYETLGRFGFEIDTTTAQAMIMQGEATETGVKLTWQQDDFDTLLGYNVYRSDKEDGLYTRLNDYVLAADENEFFDSTVEPGKLYYYNFTVVKTDMQESTPSGKIVIRAMDTMAPNIYHSPVRTAYTGQKLIISATVTDNLQISSATLYYRVVGGEWKSYVMYNNNSRYYGIVGAENISLDGLEYYIDAFDGVTHTYNGTADKPYFVTVKVAVDDNSLGDVDGDGVITNRDALMLLQAANDKLNLTEEQFKRADIDKNGELSASEAMRILQYVSGKIGSIV